MIKMNNSLPEIVDASDPMQVKMFLDQVRLFCEELAEKAKQSQSGIRNTVPNISDVEEGEDVQYDDTANFREYTKINGVIRFKTLT